MSLRFNPPSSSSEWIYSSDKFLPALALPEPDEFDLDLDLDLLLPSEAFLNTPPSASYCLVETNAFFSAFLSFFF